MEHTSVIEKLVQEKVAEFHGVRERYCELSITDTSRRGVLIQHHKNGDIDISLDESVPWLTIHEHLAYNTGLFTD